MYDMIPDCLINSKIKPDSETTCLHHHCGKPCGAELESETNVPMFAKPLCLLSDILTTLLQLQHDDTAALEDIIVRSEKGCGIA